MPERIIFRLKSTEASKTDAIPDFESYQFSSCVEIQVALKGWGSSCIEITVRLDAKRQPVPCLEVEREDSKFCATNFDQVSLLTCNVDHSKVEGVLHVTHIGVCGVSVQVEAHLKIVDAVYCVDCLHY